MGGGYAIYEGTKKTDLKVSDGSLVVAHPQGLGIVLTKCALR